MPSEWRQFTLGEIAVGGGRGLVDGPFGSNLPASDYVSDGVPVIRGSNLTLGGARFVDSEFVFVTNATAERLARSLCEGGDIIFTKKGTLGQTGFVPTGHRYPRFLLSSNQMKLSVNRSIADPLYVYYCVSSEASRAKIVQDSTQTGVPKTNVAYLKAFPILLPPLPEQQRIAALLNALDDKIEQNRRTGAKLEGLARAVFKAWFVDFEPVKAKATGATAFPGMPPETFTTLPTRLVDSELGLVPEGWEVKPIGAVVTVRGGGTPSTKNGSFWTGGIHYWATPKDLSSLQHPILLSTERQITDAGVAKISSGILPIDTVLLSSRAPVGYLALAKVPISVNQGFIAICCTGPLTPHFMLLWLHANMTEIKGRASGTTFAEISKAAFRPIPAIVPAPHIIQVFEDAAKPIFDMITHLVRESAKLASLRDYVLPRLLSGRARVVQ